jgi:hypothetical protein
MTISAPLIRAAWIAASPIPPTPMTQTLLPG